MLILVIGKYHRGKKFEGQWVFDGVERESKRCFLVPVMDGKAEPLMDLIFKWIKPGSIIISDCWTNFSKIKYVFGLSTVIWINIVFLYKGSILFI